MDSKKVSQELEAGADTLHNMLEESDRKEENDKDYKLSEHERMIMSGQEIVFSNATGGTKLEVRVERARGDDFSFSISNFKARFEFEYKYQADVK